MPALTPTERALRLLHTEMKATRVTMGRMEKTLNGEVKQLRQAISGMQVALSERERDIAADRDVIHERLQTTHERLQKLERRHLRPA